MINFSLKNLCPPLLHPTHSKEKSFAWDLKPLFTCHAGEGSDCCAQLVSHVGEERLQQSPLFDCFLFAAFKCCVGGLSYVEISAFAWKFIHHVGDLEIADCILLSAWWSLSSPHEQAWLLTAAPKHHAKESLWCLIWILVFYFHFRKWYLGGDVIITTKTAVGKLHSHIKRTLTYHNKNENSILNKREHWHSILNHNIYPLLH